MFDFVRTHSRLMLGLMVLLIFPSFVFFGIQGYSRFTDGASADVAVVDGHGISRAEWDQAHQRQIERMRQQMPGVDVRLFDTPELKRQTLDSLVQERVLRYAAERMHLAPGNDRLDRLFKNDPSLAPLRNPDGSVNRDMLSAQGMSSQIFAERLRQDYAMQQVLGGVGASALVPMASATAGLDAVLQRREIQYERFDPAAYRGRVQPTDADLEAYHKAHASEFVAPEQATIDFVQLDLDGGDAGNVRPYAVEIGWTWLTPAAQRTGINTEAKLLMLQHAFETWGCLRVEFKTDSLNIQSRTALKRLGAVEEGIFRNHVICASGRIRHSVYFSITNEEWPAVKQRLIRRLASGGNDKAMPSTGAVV